MYFNTICYESKYLAFLLHFQFNKKHLFNKMLILDIMKTFYYFSFIFISLSLAACSVNKKKTPANTSPVTELEEIIEVNSTPQIIFMNFELSSPINGEITANLVNTIITEGKIKGSKNSAREIKIEDLVCKGLDKNGKVIQSLSYDNPMKKNIEYVNDEGELEKKQITLNETYFSIRMQLNPNTKSIALERFAPDNSTTLITFEIEQK